MTPYYLSTIYFDLKIEIWINMWELAIDCQVNNKQDLFCLSKWLLLNANSAIFQLYHGENN